LRNLQDGDCLPMLYAIRILFASALLAFMPGPGASEATAQDNVWRVSKVSGEAWIGGSGVQPASLGNTSTLNPGDMIRTGRNGRVLLVRGAETMLISANSQISLPRSGSSGLSTTIIQQAGSILLDVEKRNVQHFEVETPFLAAVVKGTQFRVTVSGGSARVEVSRGQVQVADFRSGQFALVQQGQAARVSANGSPGLNLSGAGRLGTVQQGTPRTPSVQPATISRSEQAAARASSGNDGRAISVSGGTVRIGAALGEVKVDVQAVTRGLSRGTDQSGTAAAGRSQASVWSTGELSPNGSAVANSQSANSQSANTSANGSRGDAGKSSQAGAVATANAQANGNSKAMGSNAGGGNNGAKIVVGNAGGNGNGNSGGNGNGNSGGNGNGNSGSNGNGNSGGSGNGNSGGNGNGNAGGNGNGNGNGQR
jgi:hypothetical protein